MSQITYGELLSTCHEYSGHDCFKSKNKRFARRVLERMFFRGKHGSIVSISMCANNGVLTLPEDVEHVEKIKVNGCVKSLYSFWYDFSSVRNEDFHHGLCGVTHLPNKYFTQYDPPMDEFEIVVKPRNKRENSDTHIIVQGIALNGEKIFTRRNYNNTSGEFYPITDGCYVKGSVRFAGITGIEKTKSKDYIDLYARDVLTGQLFFLSGYSPREMRPFYTRIKVGGCPDNEIVRLDMLARLKILPEYACNELIPVIGLDVLETICQEIQLMKDNDFQSSVAAGAVATQLIRDENNYKYGNNVDVMNIVDMGTDDSGVVF